MASATLRVGAIITGPLLLEPIETAVRLKKDSWRYAVFHCASTPQAHAVRDPARLG